MPGVLRLVALGISNMIREDYQGRSGKLQICALNHRYKGWGIYKKQKKLKSLRAVI
jgi:hypothetical protein